MQARSPTHFFEQFTAALESLGVDARQRQALVESWLAGRSLAAARFPRGYPPSRHLLESLPHWEAGLGALVREREAQISADGSCRWLLGLADGRAVESVALAREGLCVSSQVGCAVGCRFCRTGLQGLTRGLEAGEILAQVAHARRTRAVRRVVFMGMGEPAHNLAALLEALLWLGTAGRLGHKQLVVSTVGDEALFAALERHAVKPALALSLHSTQTQLRQELLPRAPRWEPRELLERALGYARDSGHPLQVQWTMIAGVNDGLHELERLADWLQGQRALVNFIPFNEVEGLAWRRPDWARCVELVRALKARGVFATLRRSAGQDVDGGCGQLWSRQARPPAPAREVWA